MKKEDNKEILRSSRWVWLVVVIFGGLLMIFGGVQDVLKFFAPELSLVPTWYSALPLVALVCGLIVLASAGMNLVWGLQLRQAEPIQEKRLAQYIAALSGIAVIADWISGYYGFGSLLAVLVSLWLIHKNG